MLSKTLSALALFAAILGFLTPTATALHLIPSPEERFREDNASAENFCRPFLVYRHRTDHKAQAYDECVRLLESHPVKKSQHNDNSEFGGGEGLDAESCHSKTESRYGTQDKKNSRDDPIFSMRDDYSVERRLLQNIGGDLLYMRKRSQKRDSRRL
ncbi:hypothetical protein B0J14DRAFT_661088 [Halenospora varia]|nr:hypothetical protein B0J14DRAFT_661088 [Halenospora varia]